MGAFTNDTKNEWLTDFTDSIMYLALFVGDPKDGGTELSASNYARVAVPTASWGSATSGAVSNTALVTFAQAAAAWTASNVTYWALYTAVTGGTLRSYDDLAVELQQPIALGNTVKFNVGDITLSLTDGAND